MSDLTVDAQHGSSGAQVEIHDYYVMKTGIGDVGERVAAQAWWLERHASPAVPVVFEVRDDGYLMERLDEIKPYELTIADLDAIVGRLARNIWKYDACILLDEDEHLRKLKPLKERYATHDMSAFLWTFSEAAFDDEQRVCLTHGDPTLDNVMRRGGYFVITDPIPATPAVPDLVAVDHGKILQSLTGFEVARYDSAPHNTIEVRPQHLLDTLDWNDRIRAVYWCVVHYLRAMPYVDPKIHDKLKRCAEYAIRLI